MMIWNHVIILQDNDDHCWDTKQSLTLSGQEQKMSYISTQIVFITNRSFFSVDQKQIHENLSLKWTISHQWRLATFSGPSQDSIKILSINEIQEFLPGLSALNLIAIHPPVGTPIVFLSTGSTRLKFFGSVLGS